MTRKSPVQMLMDNMNDRITFKYVPIEEWNKLQRELKLCEDIFALEIVQAYYAGCKHGISVSTNKEQEYTDGMDYYEKHFKKDENESKDNNIRS